MAINHEFRIVPNARPWACSICSQPTMSWSVDAMVGDIPVETICDKCAVKLADVVLGAQGAVDLAPTERIAIARHIKARATKDLEKRHIDATARRLS